MNHFGLDASALAKRYTHEAGSDRIDHLFTHVPRDRLSCLMLGAAEVFSVLVRRRNAVQLSQAAFAQAVANLRIEVIDAGDLICLPAESSTIRSSLPLVDAHGVNATDALVLRSYLDQAALFRSGGNDVVLVAADQRLLKAAQAEGLVTFDPENQTISELDALIKA
jgi:predicted nucleic acid-binding protein